MWLKAQNEMAGLWPHAAMGPVERMVRRHLGRLQKWLLERTREKLIVGAVGCMQFSDDF